MKRHTWPKPQDAPGDAGAGLEAILLLTIIIAVGLVAALTWLVLFVTSGGWQTWRLA